MPQTLSGIRKRVRRLTGRLTEASLPDELLTEQINTYYCSHLPRNLSPETLQTWFTVNTTAGVSEYALDPRIRAVFPPVLLDDIQLEYTQDQGFFLQKYHDRTNQPQGRPRAILLFSRIFHVAPVPDDVYEIKVHALYTPEKLEGDDDVPIDPKWAECIAMGAAMLILYEDGDYEQAQAVDQMLGYQLRLIRGDDILYWHGQRSTPQW